MRKSLAVYQALLRLYPPSYRTQYAEQMVQTLEDMLTDQPRRAAKALIWLRAGLDLPISLVQQNIIYLGDIMATQTPTYVKRNALIGAACMLPFFAVVLTRATQRNPLSSTQLFQSSLYLSLIVLPAAALLLAITTLAAWSHQDRQSWWRRAIDLRRSWSLTLVATLALLITLFVPFHDSAHCLIGNPVRIIGHFSQTRQCMARGFLGGR